MSHKGGLRRLHGNDLAEWCFPGIRGRPKYRIGWRLIWECAPEVREEDQRLRLNPAIVQPGETGPEVGPATSNWRELDRLPGLVRLHVLHFGVKVQNVDKPWLLAGKY